MTLKEILVQSEWIGVEDGVFKRALHNISYANSVKLGGLTLYGRSTPLPTVATEGLYKNEKFTVPGFLYGGTPFVFQKVGCRPCGSTQRGATLWGTTDAQVTRYINRFTDGEVWISTATNSRTGTKIAGALTGTGWPRGIRYLFVHLCGGGGAGGTGGLLATYSNQGGQAAAGVVCVRLPEEGYATIIAGGGGSGVGGFAADGKGGLASSVHCGSTYAQANGGSGGDGSASKTASAGGTWQHNILDSGTMAAIVSSAGSTGTTSGKTVSYTEPTPEQTYHTTEAAGAGGSRGGSGYGAGGNGGNGYVQVFY